MNKSRICVFVLCCFMLCMVKTASANIPSIDFSELRVQMKELKNGYQAYQDMRTQITRLRGALEGLKSTALSGLNAFGPLSKRLGPISAVLDESFNKLTGEIYDINEDLGFADNTINTTNQTAGKLANDLKTLENAYDRNFGDDGKKGSEDENEKDNNGNVEEEEEEEEVPIEDDYDQEEQHTLSVEIKKNIEEIKAKNKQRAIEITDSLNAIETRIEQKTELIVAQLDDIKKTIKTTKKIPEEKKRVYFGQLDGISSRYANLSGNMQETIEQIKEKYNHYYNEKVVDGLINYEKLMEKHARGDISTAELKKYGNDYINSIKVFDARELKRELSQEAKDSMKIKDELIALNKQIVNTIDEPKK